MRPDPRRDGEARVVESKLQLQQAVVVLEGTGDRVHALYRTLHARQVQLLQLPLPPMQSDSGRPTGMPTKQKPRAGDPQSTAHHIQLGSGDCTLSHAPTYVPTRQQRSTKPLR